MSSKTWRNQGGSKQINLKRERHALPLKKTKPSTTNSINQTQSESAQMAFATLFECVKATVGRGDCGRLGGGVVVLKYQF